MKSFTDNAGRDWTVEVNVWALKRIKGLTGTDLLEAIDGPLVERLIRDPVLLCDVVYAACKPQADERGVSDEDFGRAMAGDAIDRATAALLEELVAFCPSPRDRANLGRVLQATRDVMDKARDLVQRRIDELTSAGALDAIAEAALREPTPGELSGAARDSPGSIPDP
ncbi:MAG: hypothetical protein KIT19_14755 [Phycisphaeraceae bacterium]|nr:hypothetical protein [Phycisphaeraceae bacterium]